MSGFWFVRPRSWGWPLVLLTVLAAPVAWAEGDGGPSLRGAGDARGEAAQIEVRNRSRAETGLVTRSDDYALRLSNVKVGGGGGAVYGCRALTAAPEGNRACLYADNLVGGEAFLFRSRQGSKVGHFDLGNPAGAPFSTNATGRVANLNADRLDDLHAEELIARARSKAGLAAETADVATKAVSADSATTATSATTAAQLAGKGPEAYRSIAVRGSSAPNTILSLTPAQLTTVSISVPVTSVVTVHASVEIDANGGSDDRVECRLSRDTFGNPISGIYTTDIPDGSFDRLTFGLTGGATLAPGTYGIGIYCIEAAGDTTFIHGDLAAVATPVA